VIFTAGTLAVPAPKKRGQRGRVKTKPYQAWLTKAGWELNTQRATKVAGPVVVDITVRRDNDRSDIDNRIKAVLDLLVTMQLIDDDKNVVEVRARWGGVVGCWIVVEPVGFPLAAAA
jgi:Holliday junction resolvase RusA-like endonuclease